MKNLKPYRLFETDNIDYLSPDQIEFLEEHIVVNDNSRRRLKEMGRKGTQVSSDLYVIDPKTGMVEIFGDFVLRYGYYNNLMGIKFSKIHGSMDLFKNNLKNCEGFPYEVEGYVDVSHNKIDSLKGCTQIIEEDFLCNNNNLKTLDGGPVEVGNSLTRTSFYDVGRNPLVSLKGYPKKFSGAFSSPLFRTSRFTLSNMLDETDSGIWSLDQIETILVGKIKDDLNSDPDEVSKVVAPYWDIPDFQRLKEKADFPDYFDKLIKSRDRFI